MRKHPKIGVKTQGMFHTLEIRRLISMTVPHQSYYELKKESGYRCLKVSDKTAMKMINPLIIPYM